MTNGQWECNLVAVSIGELSALLEADQEHGIDTQHPSSICRLQKYWYLNLAKS